MKRNLKEEKEKCAHLDHKKNVDYLQVIYYKLNVQIYLLVQSEN